MAQEWFPSEQFPQSTPEQIAHATPAALSVVAAHTKVYRIDFDGDGAVDRVLQIDLHARNSELIVLRRAKSGWSIVGDFFGQQFSFLGFGSLPVANLEITENNGGGHLAVIPTNSREDATFNLRLARKKLMTIASLTKCSSEQPLAATCLVMVSSCLADDCR